MKLITRETDYAIRAICFIAKRKRFIVTVNEMVKGLKITRPFLRKILQILNKKSILISHKGKGGGFTCAHPPQKIFVTDLIKTFQGTLNLNECTLLKQACPNTRHCALKKRLDAIQRYVISELRSITIASLL